MLLLGFILLLIFNFGLCINRFEGLSKSRSAFIPDSSDCTSFTITDRVLTMSSTHVRSSAPCSVCKRVMPVRNDGKIKIHGPIPSRCLGSGIAPRDPVAVAPSPHPASPIVNPVGVGPSSPATATSAINPGPVIGRIIKRIPNGSRALAATKFASILDGVVRDNSREAWDRLFLFCRRCFLSPKRGGHRRSLAAQVNLLIQEEVDSSSQGNVLRPSRIGAKPRSSLATKVSEKLEEGDFRGAVRIASSSEPFCDVSERSLGLLQERHPPSHPESAFPPPQAPDAPFVLPAQSIIKAVFSFPAGSAGGPDGVRPQHLKDLCTYSLREGSSHFIDSLTSFVNLVLSGDVPTCARPYFFGANLIGLNKKDGSIRPIAIGCTLRRLVGKCACAFLSEDMSSFLSPLQVGFGTSMGAEAAVHAGRAYLSKLDEGQLLLKLDFCNAFNCIRRDKMLLATLDKAPRLFPLAFSAYRDPSLLFFGSHTIKSSEGVQQGDPLGPLLFCLTIHDLIVNLKSEFKVFYLDDGTLGGSVEEVKSNFLYLERTARELNLFLNHSKSEIICVDETTKQEMLSMSPNLHPTDPSLATLLGSPIGGLEALNEAWESKISHLRNLGDMLKLLQAHDAICLLRNALSMPKVLYVLRTAPSFLSPLLASFDSVQKSLLESICNIQLSEHGWLQASLPINSGGLGIRGAVLLAPSAFLASAAGSASLSQAILPPHFAPVWPSPSSEAAVVQWKSLTINTVDPPSGGSVSKQKAWDTPIVDGQFSSLLAINSDSPAALARLHASCQKESGAWLTAPPVSALGLKMANESIRIAVGLRLGAPLCAPHSCSLCGKPVDVLGTHGLSCRQSKGRIPRHNGLNTIIKQALASAHIPSILEPQGLVRSDNKRPDGLTIIPWANGRPLVWDATVWDSFAPSYIALSASAAGLVAERAARRKREVYKELSVNHIFTPVAFESTGVFGKDALTLIKDIAHRSRLITHDQLSYLKLCQRLSICIQNFNCASILGCSHV